jgi:hypothetical protein
MKKIFTLTMLLALALTVNAQGYRKWDFTQWSAQTIDNLNTEALKGQLGGSWSDIEKSTSGATTPGNGVCFWSYGDNVSADGYLMANGAVIAETEGLVWNTTYTAKRSLALAVDYPTALNDYAGPQYLWLGGGNAKSASARIYCFVIPKVRIGQKITMTVESHKASDSRGVALYAGDCTNDANQIGEAFKPTTQDTYTWENWELPEGATTNDDGTVDIQVYNTNGCHIYNIEVGTADQKSKVAFLHGGDYASDAAYTALSGSETYVVEPVAATAALTLEALKDYDAIVVSPSVDNAEAIASLKDIRPFVPTLNLNPAVYEAWGMGTLTESSSEFIILKDINNTLFRDVEIIEDEGITGISLGSNYQCVTLAGLFANDQVLATDMENPDLTAIHIHNISHNGYLYLPNANNEKLLANALQTVMNSKSKVTPAPKPAIKLQYKNQNTNVVLSSTVPSPQIFYTIDGTTPTTESTLYTEPINISTAGVTVKAVVQGDGYLLSDVAEQAVDLKDQAPVPTIAATQDGIITTVTLSTDNSDVSIFYNYEGSNDSTKSTKYTEPITLMTPKTLTAFTASQELVASELAQQEIAIEKPLQFGETLAQMDANKEEYYTAPIATGTLTNSDSKTAYFFSWGKTKTTYPYWNTEAEPIDSVENEAGDIEYVYPKNAEEKFDFQNGWAVRSRGQLIVEEITIKPGKEVGNGNAYNPATVDEFEFADQYPVTDFYLNLSEWNTNGGDPRSAMIYTTKKLKGPFAIISYISNGNSGTGPKCVFETGDDIEGDATETTWNQIGDTCTLDKGQRLYQKFVRIYGGEDEVYLRARHADGGSKAGFYNIYVIALNESAAGISEVANETKVARKAIHSLSGMRLEKLQRGLNIVTDEKGQTRKVLVK